MTIATDIAQPHTRSAGESVRQLCIACGAERDHLLEPLQIPVENPAYANHLIARCTVCGLNSAWPRPGDPELRAAYARVRHKPIVKGTSPIGAAWRSYRDRSRVRLLERVAPRSRGGLVVDVGCGEGMFMRAVGNADWRLIGTDYSEVNVEGLLADGFDARVGMLEDVGLEEGSVDVIWASHVIEHMNDPVRFLQSARRYLKPEGALVAILPSSTTLRARTGTSTWHLVNPPGHLWGFSPRTFRALLERNGFVVERLYNSIPVCEMTCVARPDRSSP